MGNYWYLWEWWEIYDYWLPSHDSTPSVFSHLILSLHPAIRSFCWQSPAWHRHHFRMVRFPDFCKYCDIVVVARPIVNRPTSAEGHHHLLWNMNCEKQRRAASLVLSDATSASACDMHMYCTNYTNSTNMPFKIALKTRQYRCRNMKISCWGSHPGRFRAAPLKPLMYQPNWDALAWQQRWC